MKKTISIIAAIMLIATTLTGCGVDTPASDVFKKHDVVGTETKDDIKDTVANSKDKIENTDKSDKTDEIKKDESDKSDKSDKTDDKSNDKTTSTDKTESKPNNNAQTTKPSGNNSGNQNASSGNKPVQESKPVEQPKHKHSYQVSSQTSATCGSEGKTVYTCSCGASYSDTTPATGHNWQTKTNSWTEQVWHEGTAGIIGCQCACGQVFSGSEAWHSHRLAAAQNREYGHGSFSETEIGGTEGYYENVQHNDQYQQCANCGATQ